MLEPFLDLFGVDRGRFREGRPLVKRAEERPARLEQGEETELGGFQPLVKHAIPITMHGEADGAAFGAEQSGFRRVPGAFAHRVAGFAAQAGIFTQGN